MNRRTTFAFLILLSALAPSLQAEGAKGWLGFGLHVDADGFFHPTVRSITVDKVLPDTPAAKAGIVVGDLLVEVEGIKVAGAKASELQPSLHHAAGDAVHLKIQHGSEAPRAVTMIAAVKP